MLTYEPGSTVVHRLDPRSKLAVQFGFAIAAVAHTTPTGLVVLSAVTLGFLWAARVSAVRALRAFRFALSLLVLAPLLEGLTLGAPWFSLAHATPTALASYRVVLILFVSAVYVRTTPVRDSRAAIQHTVPGRAGQFLGIGIASIFRFLPLLRRDLSRIRSAMAARLGEERPVRERMQLVAVAGLNRAFRRSDRFSLALRARCFAWNPTLPALQFRRADWVALTLAVALTASPLL